MSDYISVLEAAFECKSRCKRFVPDYEFLDQHFGTDSPRFKHIVGVVRRMEEILQHISFPVQLKKDLITTAYLHDIGYSPGVVDTGFHPLDGALFALCHGFNQNVVIGTMYHSAAFNEVVLKHQEYTSVYADIYDLLNDEEQMFIDFITYCDTHTSPTGETVTLDERMDEIGIRYGKEHPVTLNMVANKEYFLAVESTVESRFERE